MWSDENSTKQPTMWSDENSTTTAYHVECDENSKTTAYCVEWMKTVQHQPTAWSARQEAYGLQA